MNHTDLQKFNQAVALAQVGRKAEAHFELSQLVRTNENDSNLLLWLIFTATDLTTARLYLGKLARNEPSNPSLSTAREWVRQEEDKQAIPLSEEALLTAYLSGETRSRRPADFSTVDHPIDEISDLGLPSQPPTSSVKEADPNEVLEEDKPKYVGDNAGKNWLYKLIGVFAVVIVLVLVVFLLIVATQSNSSTGKTEADVDRIAAQGLPIYPGVSRIVFSPVDRDAINTRIKQDLLKKLPEHATLGTFVFEAYRASEVTRTTTPGSAKIPATPATQSGKPTVITVPTLDRQLVFNFYNLELRRASWDEAKTSNVYQPAYLQINKNVLLGAKSTGFDYLNSGLTGVNLFPYGVYDGDEVIMVVYYQLHYSNS